MDGGRARENQPLIGGSQSSDVGYMTVLQAPARSEETARQETRDIGEETRLRIIMDCGPRHISPQRRGGQRKGVGQDQREVGGST